MNLPRFPIPSLLASLTVLLSLGSLDARELTFQQGANGYEGAESTTLDGISERKMMNAYGGAERLGAAGVKHGGYKQLGLIRFSDITGEGADRITHGAKIRSARLELYKIDEPRDSGQYAAIPKGHSEIRAFKMLTEWKAGSADDQPEEGSSCFAYRYYHPEHPTFWGEANVLEEGPVRNIDFQFNPRSASPLQPGSGPTWMSWEITEFVQEWVNAPESNHGLFLNALSHWVGTFFASCRHDDITLRPRLVVELE